MILVAVAETLPNERNSPMENAVKNRLQSLQFGQAQAYKNIVILPPDRSRRWHAPISDPGDAPRHFKSRHHRGPRRGLSPQLMSPTAATHLSCSSTARNWPAPNKPGAQHLDSPQSDLRNQDSGELHRARPLGICVQAVQRIGNVMAYKTRSKKTSSVYCSLQSSGAYMSNQSEVWENIAELQSKAAPTRQPQR
jgi:hypothetical protein